MLTSFPIFNGLAPAWSEDGSKGPRAIHYHWDFTAAGPTAIELDLFQEQMANQLDFVQGVYWHNPSASVFDFFIPVTGFEFQVPARTQGFLPVFTGNPAQFRCTIVAAADVSLHMHFYNVPMAPIVRNIT